MTEANDQSQTSVSMIQLAGLSQARSKPKLTILYLLARTCMLFRCVDTTIWPVATPLQIIGERDKRRMITLKFWYIINCRAGVVLNMKPGCSIQRAQPAVVQRAQRAARLQAGRSLAARSPPHQSVCHLRHHRSCAKPQQHQGVANCAIKSTIKYPGKKLSLLLILSSSFLFYMQCPIYIFVVHPKCKICALLAIFAGI